MLRIHQTAIGLIADVAPIAAAIALHDRDLASQLRRALSSVTLNIAEGSGQIGGRRRNHYAIALGSAKEAHCALETGKAWGYIDGIPDTVRERFNAVIGTLHNCVMPKRTR
ncbi:hypothetical protein AKJ09_06480 [Labilithrix luteola]|uniref:Four helix bundle protein n=1 Tax=Labilithrix luteola TaxID=1391654 RepID=A0A0K1Q2F1_9BACT|nr:four helix bundle protein [Labilithrix luteola]AKU99816.1 hypothetical protein AKJ09_06480 [Labilithrix luteola]